MYLAYALFCEGASDYSYFEVLVPRVIESTVLKAGRTPVDVPERPSLRLGRKGRSVEAVAREACDGREAFHVVFVHADTGGRGQRATLPERSTAYFCVGVPTRHEAHPMRRYSVIRVRPRRRTPSLRCERETAGVAGHCLLTRFGRRFLTSPGTPPPARPAPGSAGNGSPPAPPRSPATPPA